VLAIVVDDVTARIVFGLVLVFGLFRIYTLARSVRQQSPPPTA
jgi:hypothetical protein